MKSFILLVFIGLIYTFNVVGQCDCETMNRNDGTTINQCNTLPVGSDQNTQVGLSGSFNGENFYIGVTVRFVSKGLNMQGNLSLRLLDNSLLTFPLINSGISMIDNSQVAQGIFVVDNNEIEKLRNSKIKTLSLTLSDGIMRTYQTAINADVLMIHFNCLIKTTNNNSSNYSGFDLQRYLEGRNDPTIKHLRKVLDELNANIEVYDSELSEDASIALSKLSNTYLNSKFVLLSIQDFLIGGKILTIVFQDKPDKLFRAIVKTYQDLSPPYLISFEVLDESYNSLLDVYKQFEILHKSENGF